MGVLLATKILASKNEDQTFFLVNITSYKSAVAPRPFFVSTMCILYMVCVCVLCVFDGAVCVQRVVLMVHSVQSMRRRRPPLEGPAAKRA